MNARKKKKRSRILIDSQVQCALGMRLAMHWSIFLLATIAITATLRIVGNAEQANAADMIVFALREQWVAIVVILALMPWFIHDALGLSNRFAGPIVRLRSAIRELRHDEPTQPMLFRNTDFWSDIAQEFNGLRERVLNDRIELENLRDASKLSSSITTVEEPEVAATESAIIHCAAGESEDGVYGTLTNQADIPLVQSAPLIIMRPATQLGAICVPLEM